MRIQLETIPKEDRSDHPCGCFVCERKFVVGTAAAWAYSADGVIDCGPVCPACIEEGPEAIQRRLDMHARHSRIAADQNEELAAEGVAAPTTEELRLMEKITAF